MLPLQVTFHGFARSSAVHETVQKRAARLERYYSRLTSCRVRLELVGRRKSHGKHFAVHIDLKVPGGRLAVTHRHDEDLQVAVRDAFRAARRRLQDYAREQRGDVKRRARASARGARALR